MSLGTRHVRSRASLNKFPLSLILPQRSNTAIYSYWFMSISTANIHTTPLDFFHFPSHPHRDAGYINSSWADKFRALLEEKWWNIRKREAFLVLLFFFFFLLQEVKRQQSRQQGWQVMERVLPMRQEAVLALIWSPGCLQASVLPFALWLLISTLWRLQRYAATSQATCCGRDWSNSSASSIGCYHSAAGPDGGPGVLGSRDAQLNWCGLWMMDLK